jgi:hypothetical protein
MNNEYLLGNAFDILNPILIEKLKIQPWINTNRQYFMKFITKERGDNAEELIKFMCDSISIPCEVFHENKRGYDALIKGKTVEIKYASKGKDGGYTFNQIRPFSDKYEYILFFFLDTNNSKFYTINRSVLNDLTISGQHAGKQTFTMTNSYGNMTILEENGNGSFVDAMRRII